MLFPVCCIKAFCVVCCIKALYFAVWLLTGLGFVGCVKNTVLRCFLCVSLRLFLFCVALRLCVSRCVWLSVVLGLLVFPLAVVWR